jgi:peptide/nickel transport system substrate-binding protein
MGTRDSDDRDVVDAERRRQFLQALGATGGLAILAGCSGREGTDSGGGGSGDGNGAGTGGDGAGEGTGGGDGEGGDAAGELVRLELMTSPRSATPVQFEAQQLIAEELEALGVTVEFRPLAIQQIVQEAVRNKNHQALGLSYGGLISRLVDPDAPLTLWLHSEGAQNLSVYENADYDAAVEAQRTLFDVDARRERVFEAQRIAADEVPVIVHSTRSIPVPIRSDRFSNPVPMPGVGLDSVQNHVNIEPKAGVDRLRLNRFGTLGNLNPLFGIATSHRIYRTMYDTLLAVDPETIEPAPWAATETTVVDETTVDVTLREGMTWHDGEPVTPEDVKFTFEFVPEHSPDFAPRTRQIESVDVTGDLSVRFNLNQPYAPLVSLTFVTVYLLPEHVWASVPDETDAVRDWPNDEAIGSGPFRLDFWRKQEEVGLTRFEDHFSAPKVANVSYLPVADASVATRSLESGGSDTMAQQAFIPTASIERLRENPDIDIVEVPNHGPQHLSFQVQRRPGNDVAFRRAVAWTIPRRDIVETIFGGFGTVEKDSLVTTPNTAWHNTDLPQRTYDPERARSILTEAGYTWDDDGKLRYPA